MISISLLTVISIAFLSFFVLIMMVVFLTNKKT